MKRFRFAPEALLGLGRRKLERAEADLVAIEGRRQASLARADALERQSAEVRQGIALTSRIRGADLRLADASAQSLLRAAQESRRAARAAESGVAQASQAVVEARRNVEALESLRERHLAAWRREADKEEEALAAELYLARHRR